MSGFYRSHLNEQLENTAVFIVVQEKEEETQLTHL